jgi:hypothetical protein
MKTDIEILREMFKESAITYGASEAIEPLEKQSSQRNQLILSEPGLDYKVTIRDMPEKYEAIAIKSDKFTSPGAVFKGKNGECKRSDYAIVVNTDKKKVIVYIPHSAGCSRQKIIFASRVTKKLQNKALSLRELNLEFNVVNKN